MKFKLLTSLILGMIACSTYAQSDPITPKYGVVDMDSVLLTIPELLTLQQKVDSIQEAASAAAEPIAIQLQQKMELLQELQFSSDSIFVKSTQEDAQLLYQELNLMEQKTRRALVPYQQEAAKYIDLATKEIQNVGEKMLLTFVMPKKNVPVYTSFGAPMILESPLYYSGETIDITDIVITALNPKPASAKNSTSTKKQLQKK